MGKIHQVTGHCICTSGNTDASEKSSIIFAEENKN